MDKWIIIHPTHLLLNPFMTQPAHLPPLVLTLCLVAIGRGKRKEKVILNVTALRTLKKLHGLPY